MAEQLMTEEQFRAQVKLWADKVRAQAQRNAASFSKGKKRPHTYEKGRYAGKTEYKLSSKTGYVLRSKRGEFDHVMFKFPVHGIFRAYGVGNGQPKEGGTAKTYIRRSPSDWMHTPLEQHTEELATLAAEYYGDQMLINISKLGGLK